MAAFQTEFEFILPLGYVDETGSLHKAGVMRLATAGDEIMPVKDPRVQQNPAFLPVILLSKVVTRLGDLKMVTPKVVEGLFAADFVYLQDMYNRINRTGTNMLAMECPKCQHTFETELQAGE